MVTLQDLEGAKIASVQVADRMLILRLDDQSVVTVVEVGRPGADGGWYTFPAVCINGEEVWHG